MRRQGREIKFFTGPPH